MGIYLIAFNFLSKRGHCGQWAKLPISQYSHTGDQTCQPQPQILTVLTATSPTQCHRTTKHSLGGFVFLYGIISLTGTTAVLTMDIHSNHYISILQGTDGFVQERCNSIANALELHLSSINPSEYNCYCWKLENKTYGASLEHVSTHWPLRDV